jgi:hypothetical protein
MQGRRKMKKLALGKPDKKLSGYFFSGSRVVRQEAGFPAFSLSGVISHS